jgi:hypothetical protein
MQPLAQWLKAGFACAVFLFARAAGVTGDGVPSVDPPQSASCASAEYRQFDFWIGDWDAFDVDNPTVKVAHNRVDSILGGCVLLEDYQGTNGSQGQSFSIYDASRVVWHQSWVTNRGRLLMIEGKFEDGEMVLAGVDRTADGKERHVRGTWKSASGGVRETAVTSTDGGKTWQPWFDLMFRPHNPN